jgi:hypothetical protein
MSAAARRPNSSSITALVHTTVGRVFAHDEVKWDGYRCLALKVGDAVALRSRNASNLMPSNQRSLCEIDKSPTVMPDSAPLNPCADTLPAGRADLWTSSRSILADTKRE